MEFRILGPVEVWDHDGPLAIRRPKELCLLAVLLLHANLFVSNEQLVDEVWPDPPGRPAEAVQELVYQLRKAIEASRPRGSIIERHGEGYRMAVGKDELDLQRFERLVRAAVEAKQRDDLESASWTLQEALSIWRGPPLANVVFEPLTVTSAEVERLKELRLNVLIERIELELELGRDSDAIVELEPLIADNRLDERLRALLMLAFYRAGRQADALSVYQDTRSVLLDELGIEPGRPLQLLQQSILRHDPELDLAAPSDRPRQVRVAQANAGRAVVVCANDGADLDALLVFGEPLGRSQLARDLILVLLVTPGDPALSDANAFAQQRRTELLARGTNARAAAFTSPSPASDISRLASREDVDLLLLPCPEIPRTGVLPEDAVSVLTTAPCDTGLLTTREQFRTGPIVVPFGALEHDWSALEVGAWIAAALGANLTLLGTRGRSDDGARDSSRLLSEASLLVQQFLDISADVRLIDAGVRAFLDEASKAALLVLGLPDRWRQEGIGSLRATLAREALAPVLLVRRGTRPGGLAPRETATIFSWSLQSASGAAEASGWR